MKFNVKIEDIINRTFQEDPETYCNWDDYIVRKVVDESVYCKLLNHEAKLTPTKKSRHNTKKRQRNSNQRKTFKTSRGHVIF